jgi:hypothetical protein
VKPLDYRELFWEVSFGPTGEDFVMVAYDDEHLLFDTPSERQQSADASRIELADLISRLGSRSASWTRRRVPVDEAREIGMQLCAALPPELVQPLQFADRPIRLKIATSATAVGDLPWEWLNDGNGKPFALRPEFMLARSVPLRFPVLPLSVDIPLRVLLLVPNPKDERLLNADYEIDAVYQGLVAAGFGVQVLDLPLLDQLVHELAADQPNIVHYIGHGGLTDGEGNLILQDADGRSRWVSASELAGLLPSSVRLLCLSTPFTTENYQVLGLSHLARAPGLVGLPTTVVNQYPVDGAVAREFWNTFYGSLLNRGGNVNEAVHAAQVHAADVDVGYADWGSFSLVVRDQTGVSFDLRSGTETAERRATEFQAQFAAENANELAQQVQLLGEEVPAGLKVQYDLEQERLSGLLDDLAEA